MRVQRYQRRHCTALFSLSDDTVGFYTAEPQRSGNVCAQQHHVASMTGVSMSPSVAKRTMSEGHKAALAAGRVETRIVRTYLNALEQRVPKLGKQRTLKSVTSQLEAVEARLAGPGVDPLDRVLLVQERLNLEAERAQMEETRLEAHEARFIEVAKSFSERNNLTWDAWRAANVPASVLRAAGLTPRSTTDR